MCSSIIAFVTFLVMGVPKKVHLIDFDWSLSFPGVRSWMKLVHPYTNGEEESEIDPNKGQKNLCAVKKRKTCD